MAHHYIARFSNGRVITRTSANRTYTHAYLTRYTGTRADGTEYTASLSGFSGSELLARKASHLNRPVIFSEVVQLEEVATRVLLKQAKAA